MWVARLIDFVWNGEPGNNSGLIYWMIVHELIETGAKPVPIFQAPCHGDAAPVTTSSLILGKLGQKTDVS